MSKVQEVEETIGFLRKIGRFKSTIAIIVLAFVIVFQQYKFSDRFTQTEHDVYVAEHDVEVETLLRIEKNKVNDQFKKLDENIDEVKDELSKVQRELGEIHATQRLILRQIKMNGNG